MVRVRGYSPLEEREEDGRAAAANARALLLAIAKRHLAQQLVPFRLFVERNVELDAFCRYVIDRGLLYFVYARMPACRH